MREVAAPPHQPPLIELRLWRQFLAVADALHFGRAAQRLNMTQPPLTQAIAQLEALLGLKLFDRTKRSVQLTVAGAALVPEARDLLARAQALPLVARASADGQAGRLRLAFVSTVGFDLLPRWVRAFREQYPKVQLELIEATGDVQLQALERGEIDAGFMLHSPGFAPPGLACRRLARDPLVLALPEQSGLAGNTPLTLKDLLDQPLVIFPRRIVPSLYDAIFAMYHASGQLPRVAQEAIQMQTIVNLVSAGLGVAWVPDSVRQFQRPGVVYRTVKGRKGQAVPGCETSLVWAGAASPALERFMAFAPG
ncbi:LysR family transcriptional regulator [Polaromonas sp.]|uniref:LysR family transcriptional regulator n=1 Tax=Polaromonas sp. TaxID=1869339 RepID=UPI00286A0E94|nr:LysR family transcriptional regulator [Polaromonas sp.]